MQLRKINFLINKFNNIFMELFISYIGYWKYCLIFVYTMNHQKISLVSLLLDLHSIHNTIFHMIYAYTINFRIIFVHVYHYHNRVISKLTVKPQTRYGIIIICKWELSRVYIRLAYSMKLLTFDLTAVWLTITFFLDYNNHMWPVV